MRESQTDAVFEGMLTLSKTVFQGGHYETAFHLLNAAVHYAVDIGHAAGLEMIEALAREQHEWINTHVQDSVMSTASARQRSGVDLYPMLIRQANARTLMIRENQRRAQSKPRTWPDDDMR
jgi:hypothetical protein